MQRITRVSGGETLSFNTLNGDIYVRKASR
jgi:hypothetical protein